MKLPPTRALEGGMGKGGSLSQKMEGLFTGLLLHSCELRLRTASLRLLWIK